MFTYLIDLEFSLKDCKVVYIIFINELLQFSVTNFHNNFFHELRILHHWLCCIASFSSFHSYLRNSFWPSDWESKHSSLVYKWVCRGHWKLMKVTATAFWSHYCPSKPCLSVGEGSFSLSASEQQQLLSLSSSSKTCCGFSVFSRGWRAPLSSAVRAHEPEETYPERWTKGRLCICGDT